MSCFPIQKTFPNMIDFSPLFVYTRVKLPNIEPFTTTEINNNINQSNNNINQSKNNNNNNNNNNNK
jgi:hypothetical protein